MEEEQKRRMMMVSLTYFLGLQAFEWLEESSGEDQESISSEALLTLCMVSPHHFFHKNSFLISLSLSPVPLSLSLSPMGVYKATV